MYGPCCDLPLRQLQDKVRTNRLGEMKKGISPIRTMEGRKEMFYLTTHSTHFIYGYMASDTW